MRLDVAVDDVGRVAVTQRVEQHPGKRLEVLDRQVVLGTLDDVAEVGREVLEHQAQVRLVRVVIQQVHHAPVAARLQLPQRLEFAEHGPWDAFAFALHDPHRLDRHVRPREAVHRQRHVAKRAFPEPGHPAVTLAAVVALGVGVVVQEFHSTGGELMR